MSRSTKLSDEEIALFRNAVADSQPIKQDQVIPDTPKPSPSPAQTKADNQAVVGEMQNAEYDDTHLERGDELLFSKPGLQKQTLRKLRRGQFNIEGELDLHGMTTVMAKEALSTFLKRCKSQNKRCIRIIHGKGLGSKDKKPVIKNKLNNWLQKRDDILAFCSAREVDGGTGAIYLLLKRN